MQFTPTRIPEVVLIDAVRFGDERGFFMETFHAGKFAEAGIALTVVQDNHSRSRQGTLRGLHYQLNQPQGKLIRVISGKIFDVAVDLRRHSATFGHWVGEILDAESARQLWVPPGFAHGFLTLSETADVVYRCSDLYAPHDEHTLHYADTTVGIDWPTLPGVAWIVSAKDQAGCPLADAPTYP